MVRYCFLTALTLGIFRRLYSAKESSFPHWVANVKGLLSRATRASSPYQRLAAMMILRKECLWPLMISIEPIMTFDRGMFLSYLRDIAPAFVYIGYDNHGNHLPEPTLEETQPLIADLKEFTEVREKTVRKAWTEV